MSLLPIPPVFSRCVLALMLWPSLAVAQARPAIIVGVARDSLRGAGQGLRDAYVQLIPGGRQVRTDSLGRFRFDSVRVDGQQSYTLRLMHASLDTVGMAITSPQFHPSAGDTSVVDLAIPAADRLLGIICAPGQRMRGPAALVGFIRHPESGAPIDSVTVSLVYEDSALSMMRWPVNRVATSNATGHFAICGLPYSVAARVQLTHDGLESAEIPIVLDSVGPLTLRAMTLVPARGRVGQRDAITGVVHIVVGEGRVQGKVVDKNGLPVSGARVQVDGTPSAMITSDDGSFRLDSVPLGTQTISARKIGYAFVEQAVDVDRYDTRPVVIRFADVVTVLDPVVSTTQRERDLDETGFRRRQQQGLGFFLEGEQIDRAPPVLGEALRMVPGIRVGYDAQNQRAQKTMIMSSRDEARGCIRFVVDGVYWQELGGDIERYIKPQELEALEMYNPSTVPGEFAAASRGKCSVLVLWTKHKIRSTKR